jgi:ethanolamine permease
MGNLFNCYPLLCKPIKPYVSSALDIWALGITIAIGGQYFFWNAGLESGFGSFALSSLVVGTAYTFLCCCCSEISSTLPFAGGAYGLARCTLGYYLGYLVGCFEALQYIIYVSSAIISLGSMILPPSSVYHPLLWLLFYAPALATHIAGGKIFWHFNFIVASISLLLIVVYCLGSASRANFLLNAPYVSPNNSYDNPWFVGGLVGFLKFLPTSSSFFLGVQTVNIASDEVQLPKKAIPLGQMACMATLSLSAVCVLLVSVSLPPGARELSLALTPLSSGNST